MKWDCLPKRWFTQAEPFISIHGVYVTHTSGTKLETVPFLEPVELAMRGNTCRVKTRSRISGALPHPEKEADSR